MITIHYGERNIFGDRTMFPFAFAMLGSNFITIQAFTDLILKNSRTKIVLLHAQDDIDLSEVSTGIERNIKSIPGYDVAFTSPIYDKYIPLQEIRESFARVIIVLSSAESTRRALCLAYHEGMIFPKYQWIFKERFDYDFEATSFHYEGKYYTCTETNVNDSVFGSVNFVWSAVSVKNNRTNTDAGLTSTEYEYQYEKQRVKYMSAFNESSTYTEWARGFYDAVWSLAFALNDSLGELNMNLTQMGPGSMVLAQTIGKHMLSVDFQGMSGRINFDDKTGSNIAGELNIYQFREKKSIYSSLIGFYTSEGFTWVNDTIPEFVKSSFDMRRVQVSTAFAVSFLIITIATLLFAIPIQLINIVYRNHKTIKATSPKLNHIIFLGCYLTVVGTVLYIITEAWQQTVSPTKSHLCNVIPWCLSIGTAMIVGTICTKTWRLYRIYALSKRVLRSSPKFMSDPVLGGTVGVLVAIDILICLIWTSIDPLKATQYTEIQESGVEELPMIVVTVTCQSKWLTYWSSMLIGYKCILTACSFLLALLTRIKIKEFRTKNIIILAYLLAITFGLGVPMYTIVSIINVSISIRFIILCLLIDTIVYICLFALFLPSVIPLVREKTFNHELSLRRYTKNNRKLSSLKPQSSIISAVNPLFKQQQQS